MLLLRLRSGKDGVACKYTCIGHLRLLERCLDGEWNSFHTYPYISARSSVLVVFLISFSALNFALPLLSFSISVSLAFICVIIRP